MLLLYRATERADSPDARKRDSTRSGSYTLARVPLLPVVGPAVARGSAAVAPAFADYRKPAGTVHQEHTASSSDRLDCMPQPRPVGWEFPLPMLGRHCSR